MNDFREQFLNNPHGQRVEHTANRFKIVNGFSDSEAFSKESETRMGNNGENVVTVDTTLYKLACGHYLFAGPQDIGGACHKCQDTVCARCIVRCARCFHIFCVQHVTTKEEGPVCSKCGNILLALVTLTGFGLVIAAFIKGIHWLLSQRL